MAVTTFKNIRDNKSGTLLTAITATQTTLTLNTGQGASFPAAPFYISCDFEVMICTAKVADVFTVQRGVDNTIAAIHAAGSLVEMRSVAALWNDLAAAINAIESGNNQFVVDASVAANAAIALSKLARYPFTNADLASDVPRTNQLTNGGLENWQRGNGPFTTNAAYCADRWQLSIGIGTLSASKDTTNQDRGSACAACTTTGGPTTASPSILYQNFLSGTEFLELRGKVLSLSIRVKASIANACRIGIFDSVGLVTTYSPYHSGDGTYQTLTVTATAITTTATNCQVRVFFEANGIFYIDNAMLVIGSVPVDYQPLTPADDLARCQRYYQVFGGDQSNFPFIGGGAPATAAGQIFAHSAPFRVEMGGFPVSTVVGTWSNTNCGNPAFGGNPSKTGYMISVTSNAAGIVQSQPTNVGNKLTFEWNP